MSLILTTSIFLTQFPSTRLILVLPKMVIPFRAGGHDQGNLEFFSDGESIFYLPTHWMGFKFQWSIVAKTQTVQRRKSSFINRETSYLEKF